jgi:hypothetical protein
MLHVVHAGCRPDIMIASIGGTPSLLPLLGPVVYGTHVALRSFRSQPNSGVLPTCTVPASHADLDLAPVAEAGEVQSGGSVLEAGFELGTIKPSGEMDFESGNLYFRIATSKL